MKKFFPVLIFIFIMSCTTQNNNIKFNKEYKKEVLNTAFYLAPIPKYEYVLVKHYFYTDSLLQNSNFSAKRVNENLDKIEIRKLFIEAIGNNTTRMSKRINFEIKEDGYGDIDIYNSTNMPESNNKTVKDNSQEIIQLDLSALSDKISEKYIFIFKVDSWGFKYIDYKGSFMFLNTTGIIYDIEKQKIIWKRIKNTDIEYNTSVQFIGFTDKRSLYYTKLAIDSLIDDYIMDLRR